MKKSYYAVIPADVRYDKDLPMGARLLYGELTALSNEKGYCWATNGYFADLYEVTRTTISNWVTALEEGGYIGRELVFHENSKEVKERRIHIHPPQKILGPPPKNFGDLPKKIWGPSPKNL